MPTIAGSTLLSSSRLTYLIQDRAARYQNAYPLTFLDRLAKVDADDDEITAVVRDRFLAADIVADDQAAAVYDSQTVTFMINALPNIKSGTRLSQSLLSKLNRLARNPAERGDMAYFEDWQSRYAARAVRQCYEQADAIAASMYLDTFTYSRNGLTINVGTWGMPSDLKATPSHLWTDPVNATPITDVLTMRNHAQTTYGVVLDRITISTADLLNAYATAEFKAQVASLTEIAAPIPAASVGTYDLRNKRFFSELLQMELVVNDRTNRFKNNDGTEATQFVLPRGKVVLDTVANDRTGVAFDWANAPVTESLVATLFPGAFDVPAGEQRGPIGYYTGNPDLNPPNLRAWGVMRGFPRKYDVYSSALLTVQ